MTGQITSTIDFPDELDIFKRQESVLLLINMAVLGALFIVHIGFLFEIGAPPGRLIATLSLRFIILIFELLWVQKISPETNLNRIRAHTHLSIWLNIFFAFVASVFGGMPDSHYSVLMIIPIIIAAYRFSLVKTLLIVAVVIVLTVLEVRIYFWRKPPIDFGEFFEAATVSLIFLVVGLVVWLLVNSLRAEEKKLNVSLKELKETQTRLVAEEKLAAVGRLSSAIAHEIRNPVAMIASSLAMAEKQTGESALRSEMLGIAAQEAARLETMTTDFLAYARVKEPEKKLANVAENLEYAAALIKAKAAEKRIDLKVFCAADLKMNADSLQIQQALLNLLVNALEATPAAGEITLGALAETNKTIIFVENSGAAISEEVSRKIFEPFFTAKPNGTGLGLAIVQSIARAHRGEIRLAENQDGKVRFELQLPGLI